MNIAPDIPSTPLKANRPSAPQAVVIGAGIGGLTAAALLGKRGYQVTVFDPLDRPGGRAYAYRQDGFVFDAGPTIITAPWLFEKLWKDCGGSLPDDLDIRKNNPFYKIRFSDGSVFTYSGDRAAMEAEIAKFEPDDVAGYRTFMEESRQIYEYAFLELADKPFHSLAFTLSTFSKLIRLGGYRSVYSVVKKHFKSEKLRSVFSFHPLLIGGNPFTTTSFYCLIAHLESKHGVHYAMGGTNKLASGIATLVEKNGGAIRLKETVETITTDGKKVTGVQLASGETVPADVVVSNCDSAMTYGKLLKNYPRKRWTDSKIKRGDFSMSLFVWYFGTDRQYNEIGHHTMLFGPRYKGLLRDIFIKKRLAEDFSLYLHRPTANDPSLAPSGCDAFYVLSPVPNLASGTEWGAYAETYRKKIETQLENSILPGLSKHVVSSRVLTPFDFRERLLSWQGAAFSFEPKLLQSSWFRPHNKSEEVNNLYLCGAGTHPGAGLPGVVCSAQIVADLVPDPAAFSQPDYLAETPS